MEEKIKPEPGDRGKTSLLSLWARSKETQKAKPLLIDRTAAQIINKIDYDFSQMEQGLIKAIQLFWIIRCINIDRTVQQFLERYPKATVVNIGCGLDTTFERVNKRALHWYDLDLPDTIALRRKLIPESGGRMYIDRSVFDTSWFDKVIVEDNILFIAGGVFCYCEERQIKDLFKKIATRFHGGELIFNAFSPLGKKMSNIFLVKGRKILNTCLFKGGRIEVVSPLKWGLSSAKEIERWDSRIKILEEYPHFSSLKKENISLVSKLIIWLVDIYKLAFMVRLKFD
ncbi:MAG: class I SAM-dependent methyltransferase [Desulfobacteraceae bacterium]|nr:class I SAM-dependent methyltransferase [Desulfobacteraceae bacterium]